jgi:hypothetical protein
MALESQPGFQPEGKTQRSGKQAPCPPWDRTDLEDAWLALVQEKRDAYESSVADYRQMLNATSEAHSPEPPAPAVAEVRLAAGRAREEYRRVLSIFTALVLHGKVPRIRSLR